MKKQLKKTAAVVLSAVMAMGMLASCGSKNEEKSQIIMGTNAEFPPFEFVADEGQGLVDKFDGIDVAIGKKIADKLGKELVIEDMQFEGLIASADSGKVDFVAAGLTENEERKQSVDFSDTYYVAKQIMVVAADNTTINSAEDLKNAEKVGVVMGYTGDSVVTDDLKLDDSKILRVSRGIDGVQEVKNGKLDAMVIDSATGKALAEENGLKIVEDDEVFAAEEYAIAVKKGNTELLKSINEVLAEMKANGEIDELAQKYN